jgi:hypothetical protein
MGAKANRWPASAETRTQRYPSALGEPKLSDIQAMEIPTLGGLAPEAPPALAPSWALECERWTALVEDSNLDDAESLVPCSTLRAAPRRIVGKGRCARAQVRSCAAGEGSTCCSSRLG